MTARLIIGEVRRALATLPDRSVDLVFTSPPFLGLRSYLPPDHPDKADEIGSEATPADFIDALLEVVEACDRVLAPHGSLVFELGDTYAGSGGAGGDYNPGGLRDGQPKFKARWDHADRSDFGTGSAPRPARPRAHGSMRDRDRDEEAGIIPVRTHTRVDLPGWPLDKSLCGIPSLFPFSLAYGRNLLRPERETPRWRIRNFAVWHRPNPPVGAVADKMRPACSFLTVACHDRRRWFDMEAVRTPAQEYAPRKTARVYEVEGHSRHVQNPIGPDGFRVTANAGGAPPQDWLEFDEDDWFDQFEDEGFTIPTQPYKGSHYATFPEALVVPFVASMCPEKVCRTCGEPSRRIVGEASYSDKNGKHVERHVWASGVANGKSAHAAKTQDPSGTTRSAPTLGWTDCGHGTVKCSNCQEVIPHAVRRPGSPPRVSPPVVSQPGKGSEQEVPSGDLRGVWSDVPCQKDPANMQSGMRSSSSGPGGEPQLIPKEVGAIRERSRVRHALHAGAPNGDRLGQAVGARASTSDGRGDGSVPDEPRDRPPPERREGRQPSGEPGAGDALNAPRPGRVPPLPENIQPALGLCPRCESSAFVYSEDQWRPGIVLDPFCGSGTTLQVASQHGRDAIGIDLDARNEPLIRERVRLWMGEVEHLTEQEATA